MKNKIDKQLSIIQESKQMGLMTHVVVGYPTLQATVPLIEALVAGGSDFVELQIPFSDPIADGPTIMQASDAALQQRVTVEDCFSVMKEAAKKVSVPLLFMGYYNTVLHYGVEAFCERAAAVGACGLIFPDLPPDEEQYEHFLAACEKYSLHSIRVFSPASSEERLKKNAAVAKGFVYCISRFGVTGAQAQLDQRLAEYLERVKNFTHLPLAVGFGISRREQVKALEGLADIAVVGSAVIDIIRRFHSFEEKTAQEVKEFVAQLKSS